MSFPLGVVCRGSLPAGPGDPAVLAAMQAGADAGDHADRLRAASRPGAASVAIRLAAGMQFGGNDHRGGGFLFSAIKETGA